MTKKTEHETLRCSFCNKSQRQVKKLIAGPTAFICDECVDICLDIIAEDRMLEGKLEPPAKDRRALEEEIRSHVATASVGQESATAELSSALALHLSHANKKDIRRPTPNLLLVGPSGSGKSHCVKAILDYCRCPFASVDATRLISAPYFSEQGVLKLLLDSADGSASQAEQGVVLIEHLDSLASAGVLNAEGQLVQQSLLGVLDGCVETVKREEETVRLRTDRILFIASVTSGRNRALDQVSSRQPARPRRPSDLVDQGFLPEFASRFAKLIPFRELTQPELLSLVQSETNGPLNEYVHLFKSEGLELAFSDGALEELATAAAASPGGAHNLYRFAEWVALDIASEVSSDPRLTELQVDTDRVRQILG